MKEEPAMKAKTSATTTVRVREETRVRLRKISAMEKISMTELLNRLVDEHEKSFWDGFDREAETHLSREEKKARKVFEKTLKDGLE